MKIIFRKIGIVMIFIVCFALTLILPKVVNGFYDGHLQDNVSYLDENEEAVLTVNTQSGYSTAEIVLALNTVAKESGGYGEEYFPFIYNTKTGHTVETEAAWETEYMNGTNELEYNDNTEVGFTGQIKMEELFTQSSEDFIKINPNAIQRLKKQLQQHVKSGLYEKIPNIISRQSMNDTDYLYLFYESSDGEQVISTILWKMRFTCNDGALLAVVNSYDYSILVVRYSDYGDMDIEELVKTAYTKRDNASLMTEEYDQLAGNYGASYAGNEIEWSDKLLAENADFLGMGEVGCYFFLGTLYYMQEDEEVMVPFMNILRASTAVPDFIYGPVVCLDFLNPWS